MSHKVIHKDDALGASIAFFKEYHVLDCHVESVNILLSQLYVSGGNFFSENWDIRDVNPDLKELEILEKSISDLCAAITDKLKLESFMITDVSIISDRLDTVTLTVIKLD